MKIITLCKIRVSFSRKAFIVYNYNLFSTSPNCCGQIEREVIYLHTHVHMHTYIRVINLYIIIFTIIIF